jgi:hypothetical protein
MPLTVVADDRAALAVIARGSTAAPTTLDPHVAAAARFPATRFPRIADALALVVSGTPIPATAVVCPATADEHEAGTDLERFVPRRGRLVLNLDDRDRRIDVAMNRRDTTSATEQRRGESETTESILQHHRFSIMVELKSKPETTRRASKFR